METFSDISVWSFLILLSFLLLSLLAANFLKKSIGFLKLSLIPTSVLGGILILIASGGYKLITGGQDLLNNPVFGGNGIELAEILTYHSLAIGFIATVYKPNVGRMPKKRYAEIFNSGVTTVCTYLLQGIVGLGLTLLWAVFFPGFFTGAGVLLPFGYGQGTGQAMNFGGIYEGMGFEGGKSFGLAIAALGFLSASLGGIFYMNYLRRKGRLIVHEEQQAEVFRSSDIQKHDEIPMNGSIDKFTIQIGIVLSTYLVSFLIIKILAYFIPSFSDVLYGFNFLMGVLVGTGINAILGFLKKKEIIKKEYVNPFLMQRISGFFFDLMIVAGFAAIRLETLGKYWPILLILGVFGAVSTFFYNKLIADKLFPDYKDEQFMAMYGMLTGTASTGIVLLRELDKNFKTSASDNLVYQQLPAIVFGFPIMLIATNIVPNRTVLAVFIILAYFIVLNVVLFRQFIFKKKGKTKKKTRKKAPKTE